ncbi:MAG: hypothetical protein ABSB12_02455 [Candidatus Saccharimonadales bacterium]|jgi:hypothetical protein
MNPTHKDTVYIDIDDEITSIIDKISSTNSKIVAVVLPKRATMLQSSVNMKLLKKAADAARKQVVLITSEASLLPLAGLANLHVAKTLQSKPEIPDGVELDKESTDHGFIDASEDEDFDSKLASEQPIGKLAGLPEESTEEDKKVMPQLTPLPIPRATPEDAAIEIDNSDEESTEDDKSKVKDDKPIDKKLKIPNFEKFRLRLIIGFVLLVVIAICFILFSSIFNKADITVYTKTSSINSTLTVTLDSTATSVNSGTSTIPAQIQQNQKTASQQVATTGQENTGSTASGSVSMTDCVPGYGLPTPVPAGTGIISNGLVYITQSVTSFSKNGTPDSKDSCYAYPEIGSTNITAQNPGSKYNISNANFSVASRSDVTASGSTTGGTDNIVQVVSQADISNAEQKLSSLDTSSIKSALATSLQQDELMPISGTFTAGQPTITTSANVGDQATSLTVTEATTYSMFGIKDSYLQTIVNNAINQQINQSQQSIINNGLSSTTFTVINQAATSAQITFPTAATIGPKFDLQSLKKQIAGKKAGDVRTIIGSNSGVTNVTVHYSPFWVSTTPGNVNKITIVIKKST